MSGEILPERIDLEAPEPILTEQEDEDEVDVTPEIVVSPSRADI